MLNIYIFLSTLIFTYSYGFIDLNLTLTQNPIFLSLTDQLKNLVYFNRQISTWVYLVLILLLTASYYLLIRNYRTNSFPWKSIIILGLIYTLSYTFLSHDVFKYLFSARMVVDYGLNPHLISPDQVGQDLWLRFMRWTHTPSPYGPIFTILTIPAYIVGLGKFVPTLYIFKLFNFVYYIISIKLIGLISKQLNAKNSQIIKNQLFFALNPLVLIEMLSNSHNDAPMMMFLLFAIYLYNKKKYLKSSVSLLISIGIKYITAAFIPFLFLRKIPKDKIINMLALLLLVSPILYYKQYQPWYVTWFITIISISTSSFFRNLAILFSLSALLKYIPFISTGLWSATPLEYALISFSLPASYVIYRSIKSLGLL